MLVSLSDDHHLLAYSIPSTLLVPRVVYEHRCPHCKKMIGEKDTAMSGTQMVHRACGKPFVFSSPPAEAGREKNL